MHVVLLGLARKGQLVGAEPSLHRQPAAAARLAECFAVRYFNKSVQTVQPYGRVPLTADWTDLSKPDPAAIGTGVSITSPISCRWPGLFLKSPVGHRVFREHPLVIRKRGRRHRLRTGEGDNPSRSDIP